MSIHSISQKFIARHRAPRVQIEYDVEIYNYAGWRSLRDDEDAKYIALTMPRTLSRLPYGAKSYPVEEFDFE